MPLTPSPFTQVLAVTFDLDDTLWALPPTLQKAEQAAYQWLQQHAPELTQQFSISDLRGLVSEVIQEQPDIRFQVTAVRKAVISKAAQLSGHPEQLSTHIADNAFDVFITHRHDVEYFDGVAETLALLSEQFTLGAITNGNANVEQLSIGKYFSFSVSADALGIAKPDSRLFTQAAEHAGVHTSAIAHVGDDLHCDVHGAKQAGCLSIWANYDKEPKTLAPETTKPDAIIDDIRLLQTLLSVSVSSKP